MAAPYSINIRHDTVGETLRVFLWPYTALETVLNDTADTFVTYVPASVDDYGFSISPIAVGSKVHVGNVPSWVPAGVYLMEVFVETAGVITEDSRRTRSGPIEWGDGVVSPVDATGMTFSFAVSGSGLEPQLLSYWRGAGTPIDCFADPPTAVDVSQCRLKIGVPGDYTNFLPGAGRLVAIDASIGHLRAFPTLAESAAWPLDGCTIELWRVGTAANTTVMGYGSLKVWETLR
jgi:hypothetical protein